MPSHLPAMFIHRRWALSIVVAGWSFLAASLAPAPTAAGPGPAVDIRAVTDGISVEFLTATRRNLLTFSVRMVGPDRFVFEDNVQEPVLAWIPPADLADGFYHWEAWTVSADAGAPQRAMTPALKARSAGHWYEDQYKQTHLATGSFQVEGGLLQVHNPLREKGEGPSLPMRIAGAVLEVLVPSARAATESSSNNFFGTNAGANTTGGGNSFFGGSAGEGNTTGVRNSFFGRNAGLNNTTGGDNAFFGYAAGVDNTDGRSNAFFGHNVGSSNTMGSANAFFGGFAGAFNTTGSDNAFFGHDAGFSNTTGSDNAFFGHDAGHSNTEGIQNSFFGSRTGESNTTGSNNAFFGRIAGRDNTTGQSNSFSGTFAGFSNTTGSSNAFFGTLAGFSNTVEHNNTFIGVRSSGAAGITNATTLGYRAQVTQSNSLVLGSINGVNEATADTDIGIGITAPAAPLHVRRFDNTAQVQVEDTGSGSPQQMFKLVKNGFPAFNMEDTSQTDVRWTFRISGTERSDERFTITKLGTGGAEMELRHNGNMIITGNYLTASSRAVKEQVVPVDPATVLAKIEQLPIAEWSYLKSPAERHVGPMAEDWHAAFGLGHDGRTVSPTDMAGVALAAAKALSEKNHRLQSDSLAKDQRIAELESRMARLEALLSD